MEEFAASGQESCLSVDTDADSEQNAASSVDGVGAATSVAAATGAAGADSDRDEVNGEEEPHCPDRLRRPFCGPTLFSI